MKQPSLADLRIYAREAYRAQWPNTAFVIEDRDAVTVVMRSLDRRRYVRARWQDRSNRPASMSIVEMRDDGARKHVQALDTNFTRATVEAIRALKLESWSTAVVLPAARRLAS